MKKFMTMLCLAALAMLGFQAMGQTIYITKTSVGNIWAWDASGDYFSGWPGPAINTLETATVNGTEYYTFTYTHENRANAGLVFNENGAPQTGNLEPQDGKLYNYTGGTTVEVTDFEGNVEPVEESLALRGSFNDWGMTAMTKGEDGMWTITQAMEAGAEFKFYNENAQWIGGEANGKFVVTQEQVAEGTELALAIPGNNFQIPVAGTWTLTVDKASNKLVISGEWPNETPEQAMYLIGSFNNWSDSTKIAMTKGENGLWTVKQAMAADAEFKFVDEAGNWYGGVSEGNFVVTKEQVAEGTELALAIPGNNFQIPVEGEWTLTVNRDSMNVVIAGEWPEEPVVEQAMYLICSFNEWSDSTKIAMTKGENGLWTVKQ
ncbi:MAG: starch-binding protein, partial [Muribaculaceae bacterium]|nr:starch-binding protein [Muribaculaceae bacterium]